MVVDNEGLQACVGRAFSDQWRSRSDIAKNDQHVPISKAQGCKATYRLPWSSTMILASRVSFSSRTSLNPSLTVFSILSCSAGLKSEFPFARKWILMRLLGNPSVLSVLYAIIPEDTAKHLGL